MSARSWVLITLGQAEIDDVDYVLLLLDANQKVVRLYVSVEEAILVNELNPLKHLNGEHQNSFEGKLPPAVLEEVFKTGSKQINDHHVVVSFMSKMVHLWHSNYKE